MRKFVLFVFLFAVLGCSAPDPYDEVRMLRRQYKMDMDVSISAENKASFEVKVQNLSGDKSLAEVTVWVRLFKEDKEIWKKQYMLDVTGLGNYANKSFMLTEDVPTEVKDYDAYDVVIAPDGKDDDFMSYREFARVR